MIVLRMLVCAVAGYLLGNIQTGLIVGRVSSNIDLRNHGSGSSGATNALRVLGRQQALFTLLGDFLKGLAAAGAGYVIAGWHGGMVGGLFGVVGHIWPAFFSFHGGKGVATSLGVLILLMPVHTLALFAVGVTIILLTKMVSLASVSAAVVFALLSTVTAIAGRDWFQLVFSLLMSALVVFAHRANVDRILKGTENRISASMFKRKK